MLYLLSSEICTKVGSSLIKSPWKWQRVISTLKSSIALFKSDTHQCDTHLEVYPRNFTLPLKLELSSASTHSRSPLWYPFHFSPSCLIHHPTLQLPSHYDPCSCGQRKRRFYDCHLRIPSPIHYVRRPSGSLYASATYRNNRYLVATSLIRPLPQQVIGSLHQCHVLRHRGYILRVVRPGSLTLKLFGRAIRNNQPNTDAESQSLVGVGAY